MYTGSTLLSLEQYALDDDGGTDNTSICTFEAVAGTTYYSAVAGYNAKTGTINLSWEQTIELLPNLMFPIREKWPQPVFLSNVTGGVVSVNSFDCGETVYLNVAFGNDGDISTINEFTIIMEVMNENGELIHEIELKVAEIVKNSLSNGYNYINLKNQIILELNPFINNLTGRRPIILPVIMEVNKA